MFYLDVKRQQAAKRLRDDLEYLGGVGSRISFFSALRKIPRRHLQRSMFELPVKVPKLYLPYCYGVNQLFHLLGETEVFKEPVDNDQWV